MLLLPTATYRATDFVRAATGLGIEVVVASERRQTLSDAMGHRALVVPFDRPEVAADRIVAHAEEVPVDAIVAVDEAGVVPAALAARRLGLPHNRPEAVAATRDKIALRRRLAEAGVDQPRFTVVYPGEDPAVAAEDVGLPCVVKATTLSASRGVLRADTPEEVLDAIGRIREVLATADLGAEARPDPDGPLIVESYVAGAEVAVEGLARNGRVEILALFDKPEPMEGPTFEETLLVTPSRLPDDVQARIASVTDEAARAVGLTSGPIHAEVRVGPDRIVVLELAARSIGGLCSRTLRFGTGMSLEEVILRHAAGLPLDSVERERAAAGVVMLPVPHAGVFQEIRGVDDALAVAGVESLDVTITTGTQVAPLPESSRYLGFLFARGDDPASVEERLRKAWSCLDIVVGVPGSPGSPDVE